MTDPVRDGVMKKRLLWTIVLVALAIAASFWFAQPLDKPPEVETGSLQPQSTEWAVEPEGEKVPVNLPNTPMRNVEEQPKGDANKAETKAQ